MDWRALELKLSTPLFCNYEGETALFYARYDHTYIQHNFVEIPCSDLVGRLKYLLPFGSLFAIRCHPFSISRIGLTLNRLLSNLKYFPNLNTLIRIEQWKLQCLARLLSLTPSLYRQCYTFIRHSRGSFFLFFHIASSFNVIATENVIYANTPSTQSRT